MHASTQKTNIYDHTDEDVIVIHASQLSNHFKELSREVRDVGFRLLLSVVAIIMWATVFVVEEFRAMGSFSGEGVRAGLVIAASAGTFLALHTTVTHYFRKEVRDHDWYIAHLTSIKPIAHDRPRVMPQQSLKNKKGDS